MTVGIDIHDRKRAEERDAFLGRLTAQVAALRTGPQEAIPKKFRDHAWFIAFAPVESPKIAVAVLVEHMGHGGSAAAPLAKEVIEAYFKLNEGQSAGASDSPAAERMGATSEPL